jgi:hypothetical protein
MLGLLGLRKTDPSEARYIDAPSLEKFFLFFVTIGLPRQKSHLGKAELKLRWILDREV